MLDVAAAGRFVGGFRELGPQAWAAFPRVIASLATARRREHRRVITDIVYDLVIVDEAHHLKNR